MVSPRGERTKEDWEGQCWIAHLYCMGTYVTHGYLAKPIIKNVGSVYGPPGPHPQQSGFLDPTNDQ
jgi:hypothetical protein